MDNFNILVLSSINGTLFPKSEHVAIDYIDKNDLIVKNNKGHYIANKELLQKITTPAIIEIVRDDSKWIIGGKTINQIIGSGINVSHIAILYRHHFKKGEVIYQKTTCSYES